MKKAIFPGSFNPFTIGHLDILARALEIFDEVTLAVGYNESKPDAAHSEENMAQLKRLFADCPRVKVEKYSGLTVDFAKRLGVNTIIRGFRNAADAEYERNLADINRMIAGIDTWLLSTRPNLACISSSMARELAHNGYDISPYLPTPEQCRNLCG